jgi:hypothetical protein
VGAAAGRGAAPTPPQRPCLTPSRRPPLTLNPGAAPPSWLTGTLPGDRGFDPMGLGADPKALAW